MASHPIQIFRVSDDRWIESLLAFSRLLKSQSGELIFHTVLSNKQIQCPLAQLDSNPLIVKIRQANSEIISSLTLHKIDKEGTHVAFKRQPNPPYDTLEINCNDNLAEDRLADFGDAFHKSFGSFAVVHDLEKILGKELATFYTKREEAILRLEGLSEQLIRNNEEYRRKVDTEGAALKQKLETEFQSKATKLEENYHAKENTVKKREEELNQRIKEIDDRSSKHARRDIRKDLKKILENRSQDFSLTRRTEQKRWPVHAAFLTSIVGLIALTVWFIYDQHGAAGIEEFYKIFRTVLGSGATIGMTIFYIRWNDQWFRQHADEEFRLKRLDLDIDRASWLVEMALEWRDEKGSEIPKQLLDSLSRNLFLDPATRDAIPHPAKDLLSTLMGPAAAIRIAGPGGSEIALDRQSVRDYEKSGGREKDRR